MRLVVLSLMVHYPESHSSSALFLFSMPACPLGILLEEVLWQTKMSTVPSPVQAVIGQMALDPTYAVVPDVSFLQSLQRSV
jgi:hypothetical protein